MITFASGWSEGFDGPGRRWVIYLKGCNMRCRWCANPEGISPEPETLFYEGRGDYLDQACPAGAVHEGSDGWELDRTLCAGCPEKGCAEIWRHPAFEPVGEDLSVDTIVEEAMRYQPLFGADGGVTFGGGEATLQAAQVLNALELLREAGIHTAIETNATSSRIEDFFDAVDLLICDLKCVTPELHREWTGLDNREILENLRLAAERKKDLIIRIPLVSSMNDTPDERSALCAFLEALNAGREELVVEILPMRHLGAPKYKALGRPYPAADIPVPSANAAQAFAETLRSKGIAARAMTP